MRTRDHIHYDYSAYSRSWLNEMKPLRDEARAELFQISESLEKEYDVPWTKHDAAPPTKNATEWRDYMQKKAASCGRCAHRALIFELWAEINTKSEVPVIKGKLKPPKDQQKFVDVHETVTEAANGLRAFKQFTDKILGNETLRTMISEADVDGTFADDLWKYFDLRLLEVLERAESVKGARGQPRNPDWVPQFVELCRSFWAAHMSGGARPIPHLAHPSKVTEWAETLYKELHIFGGLEADMAQFETAAKGLTKK
jgi:hypothetical protein